MLRNHPLAAVMTAFFLYFPLQSSAQTILVSSDSNMISALDPALTSQTVSDLSVRPTGMEQFLENILQGGTQVFIDQYSGHSNRGIIGGYEQLFNFYNSLPGVSASMPGGDFDSLDLAGVDLFISSMPNAAYNGSELQAISDLLGDGGTVFFLGDSSLFSYANTHINSALEFLGSGVRLLQVNIAASGWPFYSTSVDNTHPLMAGVPNFNVAVSGAVSGGMPFAVYSQSGTEYPILALDDGTVPPEPETGICESVDSGLISWWTGDTDASDNQGINDGSLINGAVAGAAGLSGGAFSFLDEQDQKVLIPADPTLNLGGNMTVEAWVKLRNYNTFSTIFAKRTGYNNSNLNYWLDVRNGRARFLGYSAAGAVDPAVLNLNEWYHIAGVRDGLNYSLYVNGVLKASGSVSTIINTNLDLYLGGCPDCSNQTMDGWIDEARIHDCAMTPALLSEIYENGGESGDPDSDGDGVPDSVDICDGHDDNIDSDGDSVPNGCDPCPYDPANDADGDGVCGDVDNCPGYDDGIDLDGDLQPDGCDVCPLDPQNDADGDGLCEADDNCPDVANGNQIDTDYDDIGDACDPDIDNDGVTNEGDNCPYDSNTDQMDFDDDGQGDVCDADDDGDNVNDSVDQCLTTMPGDAVNENGCSIMELCPCEHPAGGSKWKNHGAYMRCVAHTSEDFVAFGLITEAEKDAIVSEAGASNCGHKK